jgi:hypothetical protein
MKTVLLILAVALASGASLRSQPAAPAFPPRPPEQLEELLSPIALYPDPLVAVILPAATNPSDVVLAARFASADPDPAAIDAQPWDESVKAVAHYPELIAWMDQNLEWTQQLGGAFIEQPADVMNTIQGLRERARDAGILVDTPQQQVIDQNNVIYIVPAQPDVVYVPSYDPQVFYTSAQALPRSRSFLSFSVGLAAGPWLDYGLDWRRRSVWVDRQHRWAGRRDWRGYVETPVTQTAHVQIWRPRADASTRQVVQRAATRAQVARPAPFSQPAASAQTRAISSAPVAAPSISGTPPLRPLSPTGREPRFERASRPEAAPTPVPSSPPQAVAAPAEPVRRFEGARASQSPSAPAANFPRHENSVTPAPAPETPQPTRTSPPERYESRPEAQPDRRWSRAPETPATRVEASAPAPSPSVERPRQLPPQASPRAEERSAKGAPPPAKAAPPAKGKEQQHEAKGKADEKRHDDQDDDE